MKPATIILAMLGAARTAFGAPIEDMNAIEEVNGTLIEDSFDMPLKRVNNARTAIYTAWTGTSNNGRGCTGGQQGSTADQIGDGGNPDSCSFVPGSGCVLLQDFTQGDGTCMVYMYQSDGCTGTRTRFLGNRVTDSTTFNFRSFEALCLRNE